MVGTNKLKAARLKLRLSQNQLAGLAMVSRETVKKAEEGKPIHEVKAYSIVEAINSRLPEADHVQLSDIALL